MNLLSVPCLLITLHLSVKEQSPPQVSVELFFEQLILLRSIPNRSFMGLIALLIPSPEPPSTDDVLDLAPTFLVYYHWTRGSYGSELILHEV